MKEVSRRVCQAATAQAGPQELRWRGHRTWHIDGSSFSMPDTPELQAHFGQPTSRWIKSLGNCAQLVEYVKPRRPLWMSPPQYQVLPATLVVREIRRTIHRRGFRPLTLTVTTTLLDPVVYPGEAIVALLERRWDVETNLRHLKTTRGLEVLRTHRVAGIQREVWAFVLIYNLVRVILLEAAAQQHIPVARLSFADALYWMRYARPGQSRPPLRINPDRREPRARKRRPKNYPHFTKPRSILRKRVKQRNK